jgi:hypothetical protein
MLHSLLAWTMGLGSLGLFASGFFLPEIRRKNDLIWSGIGLFYALVMTVDSGRLRGGMVLEELASVILIVWFALQILKQRRRSAPPEKLTPLPNSMESWTTFLKDGWGRLQQSFSDPDALEALFAEEDEDSLIDISKLSATITGLFKKGDTEQASASASSAPTTAVGSTDAEDWEDEAATGAEDTAVEPVDTIATAVADAEEIAASEDEATSATSAPEQIEEEVATEVPTAESPPEPDVSGEPVEATEIEMGDRTEGEASTEQVAESGTAPEAAPEPEPLSESDRATEHSENSVEARSNEADWPPQDPPT